MDKVAETTDCIPISTDVYLSLEVSEVVDYLNEAGTTYKEYSYQEVCGTLLIYYMYTNLPAVKTYVNINT